MPAEFDAGSGAYAPRRGAEVRLPDSLRLRSVWTPLYGRLETEGEPVTRFRPQGDADHTYVHLEDVDGHEYTVEIRPFLGKAKLSDGWEGPRL